MKARVESTPSGQPIVPPLTPARQGGASRSARSSELTMPALPSELDVTHEEVNEDSGSHSGDLGDDSSGLTYDSDAGYLPRSVKRELLHRSSDSDEEEATW